MKNIVVGKEYYVKVKYQTDAGDVAYCSYDGDKAFPITKRHLIEIPEKEEKVAQVKWEYYQMQSNPAWQALGFDGWEFIGNFDGMYHFKRPIS